MNKSYKTVVVLGTATLLSLAVVSLASAMSFTGAGAAANITISDESESSSVVGNASTVGYTGIGQAGEDQETEPGTARSQAWDLEGFFLEGSELGLVGGYDFADGYGSTSSGDIFLSTDGCVGGNYGYEYVLDLDFSNSTYQVVRLDGVVELDLPTNVDSSSPYKYKSGGTLMTGWGGTFSFLEGVATDFEGGFHYAITGFDLSFLGGNQSFISHFTMSCGNDNLMGAGTTPVPEPGTMLLFGAGIVGLAGRRFSRKK